MLTGLGKDHPKGINNFADRAITHIRPQGRMEQSIFFRILLVTFDGGVHALQDRFELLQLSRRDGRDRLVDHAVFQVKAHLKNIRQAGQIKH